MQWSLPSVNSPKANPTSWGMHEVLIDMLSFSSSLQCCNWCQCNNWYWSISSCSPSLHHFTPVVVTCTLFISQELHVCKNSLKITVFFFLITHRSVHLFPILFFSVLVFYQVFQFSTISSCPWLANNSVVPLLVASLYHTRRNRLLNFN